jgi:hypothetical protein
MMGVQQPAAEAQSMPKNSKQVDSTKQPQDRAVQRDKSKAGSEVPGSHLIRIRDEQEWERAFTAFLRVPAPRVTLPGNIMGVTEQHIRVLKEEGIPFEYVSKAPNGEEDAPV